jgi:hypothetical protein
MKIRFCERLERERGFEPPAACLEGRFSTNLSYSRSMVRLLLQQSAVITHPFSP